MSWLGHLGAKFGGLFEICCKTTKPKKVSTIQGHTVTKLVSNLYMLSYEARCENLALRSQPVVRLWSKWCLDLWHGAVVTLRCMEDGTHSFKMASNGNKEASMKPSKKRGAPIEFGTPTKNQQKINRNQHFSNTLPTLHLPNVIFCSTSTKNKLCVSQKLIEPKQLVNTSTFHHNFCQQKINTQSTSKWSALGLQSNINGRSTSIKEG